MQQLWGEVLAVPEDRIRVLADGESVGPFEVAFTPGHASHHVSYRHRPSGWAFTGDVAGVRIGGGPAIAPTPPPDIDLDAWRRSLALLADWSPLCLAVTHFGCYADVAGQLAQMRDYLDNVESLARDHDLEGFAAAVRARVSAMISDPALASVYERAMPLDQSYAGLRRHLERADAAAGPGAP
jgi:glyoxylase-like metal-dependent hydrolase (beta-lactamase superfamily II)